MKGDLSTLKKVCLYGSKVMLIGLAVLVIVLAFLLILGAGSFFSDGLSDLLGSIIDRDMEEDPALEKSCAYLIIIVIFCLAVATVLATYRVMVSIHTEHSPFTETNTQRIIKVSQLYLICAVIFLFLEVGSGDGPAAATFMFFGCVLVSVVLYITALIIRYGSLLQDESDHTL
jgi:hypothetical protein